MPVGIVSEPQAIQQGKVLETMAGFPVTERGSFVTQHRTSVWELHPNPPHKWVCGEDPTIQTSYVGSGHGWYMVPHSSQWPGRDSILRQCGQEIGCLALRIYQYGMVIRVPILAMTRVIFMCSGLLQGLCKRCK